ncbi:class I SAM-dependent methyltransferase [Sphingomonas piscis]|uniref:Class I SAM-dependent methyltransferase n=1 Tax=Sphingomonas piscis TaxID=2714943 RepID=A0A6G7YLI2_9SPHN|nr:class I SAM-dependent methyltransferase [Sphingomonas piscis]QIK77605.1 class I SAM-dependent methyltransferase [Sphingomonas piscis]
MLQRKPQGWAKRFISGLLHPANNRAAGNADRLISELSQTSDAPLILIIGGGAVGDGAGALYRTPNLRVVGFDIYASENIQLIADAHQLPFADEVFDAVWIQAVLEHVLDPQRVVDELTRVLKADGLVYAETPFLQSVHEGAYDFTRFTDSGHRWLFRRFDLIDSGAVLGPFAALVWSINQAATALFRSRAAGLLAQLSVFWLKYLDRLVPDSSARDAASAIFFLGRKTMATLSPKDAIAYFRGVQRR